MTKREFLEALSAALTPLSSSERKRSLAYYDEMISDLVDEGMSEEQAVAGLEPVNIIAGQLISDSPRRPRGAMQTALIIIGFPLWFPLIAAGVVVVFAIVIAILAVIASLFAAVLATGASGVAVILASPIVIAQNPASGVFMIGAGLVFIAICLMLWRPTVLLGFSLKKGVKDMFKWLRRRLTRREARA